MYSISNETYTYSQKRSHSIDIPKMRFTSKDTDLPTLIDGIIGGHAVCHVFQNNRRLKENFKCTSLIPIDVDDSHLKMEDVLDRLDKKPTLCYTTAKNGIGDLYRFRFIYVFEDIITREHYTGLVKSILTYLYASVEGFRTEDNCHERWNQFFFGADASEANIIINNCTYHLSDFPHEIESPKVCKEKKVYERKDNSEMPDTEFFNDLKELKPFDFLHKYGTSFEVVTQSKPIGYKYGATLFDKDEYEEVFKPWSKTEINGKQTLKRKTYIDGEGRRKKLFADAIQLRRLNRNITLENLIFDLMSIIYIDGKYDNSDGKLDIYGIAQSVMNLSEENIDEFEYRGKRKSFKVDKQYCNEIGVKPNAYAKTVGKLIRVEKVKELYDSKLSIRDNVKLLNDNKIKISERTLKKYIKQGFLKTENMENKNKYINTNTIHSHFPNSEKTEKRRMSDEEIGSIYDISLSLKDNLIMFNKDFNIKIGKDRLYKFCKDNCIETNPKKTGR